MTKNNGMKSLLMKRHWTWLLLVLFSPLVLAQDGMSAVTIKTLADGSQEYSLTL